jgi:putative ABC transport system substrate-binding protein
VNRREFTLLGGAAAAWPLAARAQQSDRVRRIGVLTGDAEDDPGVKARLAAFREGLDRLGWSLDRNVRIDYRFAAGRTDQYQTLAKELISLQPDVILAQNTPIATVLQQESRTIPIVFVNVSDPIGSGLIASLARPGGNLTGLVFQQLELAQKQVELLSQAFPDRTRLAMLFDAQTADQFGAAERTAKLLNLQVQSLRLENPPYDFDAAIRGAAAGDAQMLLVLSSPFFLPHRARIVEAANARHLPSMFIARHWAEVGGLMTYGADFSGMYRRAAEYVARILKGAKPADLPVEQATKFELVVNLKTAKDRHRAADCYTAARRRGD